MKDMFGDRFEYILGPSEKAVPEFHRQRPDVKCDIISVDGDHSTDGTFADLANFRPLASCRNWVLMDDAGWNSTNQAWQKAKDHNLITQVECFADLNPRPDYQFIDFPQNRSWCLGFFNIGDLDGQCPVWFEENPNLAKRASCILRCCCRCHHGRCSCGGCFCCNQGRCRCRRCCRREF